MSNSKKLRTYVQYVVLFNCSSSLPKMDDCSPVLFDSFEDVLSYLRDLNNDSRVIFSNYVIRRLDFSRYYGDSCL